MTTVTRVVYEPTDEMVRVSVVETPELGESEGEPLVAPVEDREAVEVEPKDDREADPDPDEVAAPELEEVEAGVD